MARRRKTEPTLPLEEIDPEAVAEFEQVPEAATFEEAPRPASSSGSRGSRGRPRGARSKGGDTISAPALEALLSSVHNGLAILFAAPGLVLSEAECGQLALAAARVARHYDVPGASEKVVDWTNLVGTLMLVYGTRWAAARMARDAAKAAKKTEENKSVVVRPFVAPSFASGPGHYDLGGGGP